MRPRVTVLAALYNDAPYVRAAIDSVLGQTFSDFEYLIINDCGTDGSRDLVAAYDDPRIRLVDNEQNLGLTKSLNRGLALARGELIARFDTNDINFPERFAKQVAYLDAHPDVAAVGVQSTIIDTAGHRIRRAEMKRPVTDAAIRWHIMFGTPLIHSGAMYRRSVVYEERGGYDEEFRVGQDGELWSRLIRTHRLANIDEQLMAVRFDPRSISGDISLPVRAGFRERWIQLAHENMQHLLAWNEAPREWAELWVAVHAPGLPMEAGDALRFARGIEEALARFIALHPEARNDRDVLRSVSYQWMRAAEKAAASSRTTSMKIFAMMLRADALFAAAALPRLSLRWSAGDAPAKLWRRWRHGRA